MKKYICAVQSGMGGLDLNDLFWFENGNRRIVILQKNEYVPVEKIDKKVLTSSLLNGCLFRCLNAGWIVESDSDQPELKIIEKTNEEKKKEFDRAEAEKQIKIDENANKSQEQMAELYKRNNKEVAIVSDGAKVVLDPAPIVVKEEIVVKNEVSNDDTKEVNSFESFEKLQHFKKLSFIAKSVNKALLKEISEKSTSKQIRNNSFKRIQLIK
jgi:hypothetical protein